MSEEARIGLQLLCGVTCVPSALSFVLAWWLRGRVLTYGPLGAFLPRFLRERI